MGSYSCSCIKQYISYSLANDSYQQKLLIQQSKGALKTVEEDSATQLQLAGSPHIPVQSAARGYLLRKNTRLALAQSSFLPRTTDTPKHSLFKFLGDFEKLFFDNFSKDLNKKYHDKRLLQPVDDQVPVITKPPLQLENKTVYRGE